MPALKAQSANELLHNPAFAPMFTELAAKHLRDNLEKLTRQVAEKRAELEATKCTEEELAAAREGYELQRNLRDYFQQELERRHAHLQHITNLTTPARIVGDKRSKIAAEIESLERRVKLMTAELADVEGTTTDDESEG